MANTQYPSYIRKTIVLALALLVLFCLSSCILDMHPYKCTVEFEFTDMSDVDIIEKRIEAFSFNIKNKETDGNKVTYTIDRGRYAPNGIYDLFCSKDVVSIEDTNGEVLLTREDVSAIEIKSSSMMTAQVSENRYEKLTRVNCDFVLGDKSCRVHFMEKDEDEKTVVASSPNGIFGETIEENEEVYIKGALTLISEPPKGEVTATVIEEINGR